MAQSELVTISARVVIVHLLLNRIVLFRVRVRIRVRLRVRVRVRDCKIRTCTLVDLGVHFQARRNALYGTVLTTKIAVRG